MLRFTPEPCMPSVTRPVGIVWEKSVARWFPGAPGLYRHAPMWCRPSVVSPFPEDAGQAVYFGGFDCNWVRHSDTAWIFRTDLAHALAGW